MGYLHIPNLYKDQDILLFKRCWASEKIHGTSAHVGWKDGALKFFSGGSSHEAFVALFDKETLTKWFVDHRTTSATIFGEAYGGKLQAMSKTYGPQLRFVAFDVFIGDSWLATPAAMDVVGSLGLEFVSTKLVEAAVEVLDAERDAPSEQAFRNGCAVREDKATWKNREGVVLKPEIEVTRNNGERIIAKHKRPEFSERATVPEMDPEKRVVLEKAEAIALEWVTEMRLAHVLDKLGNPRDMSKTPDVIAAVVEDVLREGTGELVDSKETRKAIGSRAAKLYKAVVTKL